MKKVLAIIALVLAVPVILVTALDLLHQYEAKYSNTTFAAQHQKCDIETTLNERCYVSKDVYTAYEIKSGESIHIYECSSDGKVLGEYVSEDGELDYVTHSDITAKKTNSEELRQLVKSMNDNIKKLENEWAVIRVVIPGAVVLLSGGVIWATWKLLRRHRVSK